MPSFETVRLYTERLILRPLRAEDAATALVLRSNPAIMRFGSTPAWTSIDKAIEWVGAAISDSENGINLRLALEHTGTYEMIGSCTLFQLDEGNRRAEIGYELREDVWGQGYMQEALRALLQYGFENMHLNRIEADVHPENISSCKTLERLGFVKEGHLRERWIVGGEISGSIIYGLLLSDWKARR